MIFVWLAFGFFLLLFYPHAASRFIFALSSYIGVVDYLQNRLDLRDKLTVNWFNLVSFETNKISKLNFATKYYLNVCIF